jgi:hypothetical protein
MNHSRVGPSYTSRTIFHPRDSLKQMVKVEATNKTLMKTLKKKLEDKKGAWVLPEVLWSYRTTIQTSTGEAPFSLAFRYEAVIPVEVSSVSF